MKTSDREKSKVVFTTDKKLAMDNMEVFDENIGNEAREEIRHTISQMHKSKRKVCIMGRGFRDMEKKYQEISNIIDVLEIKKTTFNDLYSKFYHNAPKDKSKEKYLQNLLQTIKLGSHQIVYSKDRIWQIDPKYASGKQELVTTIKKNYSARWKMYKIAKHPRKLSVVEKPVKEEVPKPIITDKRSGVIEIGGVSGPIDIPITITITVKLNVEYNKGEK